MNDVLDSPEFGAILQKLADESGKPVAALRDEAEADLKEMAVKPGQVQRSPGGTGSAAGCRGPTSRLPARRRSSACASSNKSAVADLPAQPPLLPGPAGAAVGAGASTGSAPNNVLGGANLAMWPLSEIGQRNGIVFIRREFRDDHVYRAVLKAYLSHLIEKRAEPRVVHRGRPHPHRQAAPAALRHPQLRDRRLRRAPRERRPDHPHVDHLRPAARGRRDLRRGDGRQEEAREHQVAVQVRDARSPGGWAGRTCGSASRCRWATPSPSPPTRRATPRPGWPCRRWPSRSRTGSTPSPR